MSETDARTKWSREKIVEGIRVYHEFSGKVPAADPRGHLPLIPSMSVIANRGWKWADLVHDAGLVPLSAQKRQAAVVEIPTVEAPALPPVAVLNGSMGGSRLKRFSRMLVR